MRRVVRTDLIRGYTFGIRVETFELRGRFRTKVDFDFSHDSVF